MGAFNRKETFLAARPAGAYSPALRHQTYAGLLNCIKSCQTETIKGLLTTLCLTIAVLLGSVGAVFGLPPCPEDESAYWHNCYGTFTTAKGHKYVGEFRGDLFNGQGTYTWAHGAKHVGEFNDDKRNGQGTYTYDDGTDREGQVQEGYLPGSELTDDRPLPLVRTTRPN